MIEIGASRGYHSTSVERMLLGTGIARSTFYEHFGNRDECFLSALRSLGDRLLKEVETALASEEEAARAALGAMVSFAISDPAGARLLFVESLAGGERSLELRESLQTQIEELVEDAWAQASPDASVVDMSAAALIGGVFRLLGVRLCHGDAGLESLDGLGAWVDSYAIARGPARWRADRRLDPIAPPTAESLPSLEAPPALSGGRHRLSDAQVARGQRLRILGAVARCSYEQGYVNVSVADIAAEAEVSRRAFYGQFRDKAQAAMAANERFFQAAMTAAASEFFAVSSWPEQVWAAGPALLGFFALHPEDAYLGIVETHAVGESSVQLTYDRHSAFSLFLEEGYRFRPEAESLPKVCSEVLRAATFELVFRELRERRGAERLLALAPPLAYLLLAPFMGPEAACEFMEGRTRDRRRPSRRRR